MYEARKYENGMNKWFKILIYLMLVMIVTYFVISFTQASIVVDYLKDQETKIKDDPLKLISATAIANMHDGRDVYVLREPLYEESFRHDISEDLLDISIYPFVQIKNNDSTNMMAILVNHLNISDTSAMLDENDYHILKARITFNDYITINDYSAQQFTETFVTTYEDSMKMLFISVDLFRGTEIKRIEIIYDTENNLEKTLVTLSNSNFESINENGLFSSTFNRDIKEVTTSNLLISNKYDDNYTSHFNIYYDEMWLKTLSDYNSYYIKYAIIEMLFVIPITYLVFFHKYVKRSVKTRKAQKNEAYNKRQNELKDLYRKQ